MPHRVTRRRRAWLVGLGTLALAAAGVGVAAAATPSATPGSLATAVPVGSLSFGPPAVSTAPGAGSAIEQRLFATLNQQRATNGLGPLSWSAQLAQSSLTHNRAMAAVDTLSHQLPGEPDFGARITATGYRWRAAAENIGWNGQATDDGANAVQWMFYNETPPNDGHRRNILSTSTSQVGISVLYDGKGKVWITEDFGQPT